MALILEDPGTSNALDHEPRASFELTQDRFLKLILEEPKVLDAFITDARVLYVAVISDGTRRDGYARYLCEVVRAEHAKVDRVKVVEYGTTKSPKRDNAYGILLGEAWCK